MEPSHPPNGQSEVRSLGAEPFVGAEPSVGAEPVLMDTHVWLWTALGDETRLPSPVMERLDRAGREGMLRVSAISVWELGMLEAAGRLGFDRPVAAWVEAALSAPGVALLPLDPDVALESSRLPGEPPGDPAHRMIIASARCRGWRLCTADRRILQYGSQGHVRLLPAR